MQVKIPYETGMNPYSGLVDLFEKSGLLKKEGNRLTYIAEDGTEIKQFRKPWEANENGCLDLVMAQYSTVKTQQEDINIDVEELAEEGVE